MKWLLQVISANTKPICSGTETMACFCCCCFFFFFLKKRTKKEKKENNSLNWLQLYTPTKLQPMIKIETEVKKKNC